MHPYHERRNSKARLAAISEYLDGRENFTVLELGALDGYFSARLAERFNAQCTAVDDSPHLTAAPGVTAINRRPGVAEIRKLGKFDVVLCLSVLHHLPQWRATLKAMLDVAPVLFVESAHPDENLPGAGNHKASAQIHKALEDAGGTVLTYTPGYDGRFERPLFVIDNTPQPDAAEPIDDAALSLLADQEA